MSRVKTWEPGTLVFQGFEAGKLISITIFTKVDRNGNFLTQATVIFSAEQISSFLVLARHPNALPSSIVNVSFLQSLSFPASNSRIPKSILHFPIRLHIFAFNRRPSDRNLPP
jgi:hypothetical protein